MVGSKKKTDSVTRSLKLPGELGRRATRRAKEQDLSFSAYVRRLIKRDLSEAADEAAA